MLFWKKIIRKESLPLSTVEKLRIGVVLHLGLLSVDWGRRTEGRERPEEGGASEISIFRHVLFEDRAYTEGRPPWRLFGTSIPATPGRCGGRLDGREKGEESRNEEKESAHAKRGLRFYRRGEFCEARGGKRIQILTGGSSSEGDPTVLGGKERAGKIGGMKGGRKVSFPFPSSKLVPPHSLAITSEREDRNSQDRDGDCSNGHVEKVELRGWGLGVASSSEG